MRKIKGIIQAFQEDPLQIIIIIIMIISLLKKLNRKRNGVQHCAWILRYISRDGPLFSKCDKMFWQIPVNVGALSVCH